MAGTGELSCENVTIETMGPETRILVCMTTSSFARNHIFRPIYIDVCKTVSARRRRAVTNQSRCSALERSVLVIEHTQ